MNKNDTLKEYYVKLHELYNSAVNMLTAINQSLTTSASEITVDVADTDDTHTTVRIPSFLYLENKLEQLDMNFSALFNMPESGEAWFSRASDMFKLKMIKSNSAPLTPTFDDTKNAYTKVNWLLKDLVTPQTYLKLYIDNLSDNIEKMFMKKIVIYNVDVFNQLQQNTSLTSYSTVKEALYNFTSGVDYEEYDNILPLPIKRDEYRSEFRIVEIPELESGNPYTSSTLSFNGHNHLEYKLRLDTIRYTNQEDDAQEFELKTGDYICLQNQNCIYKIKNVNTSKTSDGETENYVIIEEYIGHQALQTFEENQNMVLSLYNENYDKYHYAEIPLEENPYICVFLGTIQNNVRSNLSRPYFINLNNIYMKDENGNDIYEGNSTKPLTYIQYYKKYCKNIGDLIVGLTETTYPQLSNYYNEQLLSLTTGEDIRQIINLTVDDSQILKVYRINEHKIDDETTNNILRLHGQKATLNTQLKTVQDNINRVYNTMTTTDFQQEVNITQESLRSKLNEYYQERISLQSQQISVIDNINSQKGDAKGISDPKYRVRGIAQVDNLLKYLHENYGDTCEIIGMEVEYKYKSTTTDPKIVDNNSMVFTDWVKQPTIERERYLDFDASTNAYKLNFVDYNNINNIIKWNQIDIPISQGEAVVLRIRYKYNIGQPFINLYSPWSQDYTVDFPTEFEEEVKLLNIIEENDNDVIGARFNKTLINEGYEEHISNRIVDNSQTFYHQPENIYSGFNTPENKLISLKDKLNQMSNELEEYKTLINTELNAKYEVYLTCDGNMYELSNLTQNNIKPFVETFNGIDSFIRKEMNIVIKNTGDVPINLYSIFPGDIEQPLMTCGGEYYLDYAYDKVDYYDRVPILFGTSQSQNESMMLQTFGQFIYFRNNNPYTNEVIYIDDDTQNNTDIIAMQNTDNAELSWNMSFSEYLSSNKQPQYAKKIRMNSTDVLWNKIIINNENGAMSLNEAQNEINMSAQNYIYNIDTTKINNFVLKYENIYMPNVVNGVSQPIYLTQNDSISRFCQKTQQKIDTSSLNGAILIPQLNMSTQLLCSDNNRRSMKNQYYKLDVSKSISIPVLFEYYIDGINCNSVSKTLCFDIKTSLLQSPINYVVKVTAEYNRTTDTQNLSRITSLKDKIF